MPNDLLPPVTVYIVHHPGCENAEELSKCLYDWFRLGYLAGGSSAAGLPVFFRRMLTQEGAITPSINFNEAALNVVILLVDHQMVHDRKWRKAIGKLSDTISKKRDGKKHKAILVPAALHDSFYRTGSLYQQFNPIRLIDCSLPKMKAVLRRAATEAIARALRSKKLSRPETLQVFLSHAKRDGVPITEKIRDSIRKFSQLEAWYDANDLPIGTEWKHPMEEAVATGSAAMIATVTNAYPTRPWCRREALLARTPVCVEGNARVWEVQPVVAIHDRLSEWVRGVPMLNGVPRIGWDPNESDGLIEVMADRLVLEVLLGDVHRRLALKLSENSQDPEICYITWVPDAWSLAALRQQMSKAEHKNSIDVTTIKEIVYPGYSLSKIELDELECVVKMYSDKTKLTSFEEVL